MGPYVAPELSLSSRVSCVPRLMCRARAGVGACGSLYFVAPLLVFRRFLFLFFLVGSASVSFSSLRTARCAKISLKCRWFSQSVHQCQSPTTFSSKNPTVVLGVGRCAFRPPPPCPCPRLSASRRWLSANGNFSLSDSRSVFTRAHKGRKRITIYYGITLSRARLAARR